MENLIFVDDRLFEMSSEMYRQLGGNRFKWMTGAIVETFERLSVGKQFSVVSLLIHLPCENKEDLVYNLNEISKVCMHFMFDNTYTFEFLRKGDNQPFKTVTNVHYNQVKEVFKINTGILTAL